MADTFCVNRLFATLCVTAALGISSRSWGDPLPLCSLAKINHQCALPIDRTNPLSPSTVQMYEGEILTVVVENPYGFERYFLDTQSGQMTLKPDTTSSVIQGLLPSLQKTGEFKAHALGIEEGPQKKTDVCKNIADGDMPAPGQVDQMVDVASVCLGQLASKAIDIYQKIEPLVAPDSLTPIGSEKLNLDCKLQDCITGFLASEIAFSSRVTSIGKDTKLNTATNPTNAADMTALAKLAALQKSADSIAADLQGYKQRLADLPAKPDELTRMGIQDCAHFLKKSIPTSDGKPSQCIAIKTRADSPGVYGNMATRTVTYTLNTFNLVSNAQEAAPDPSKKKLLSTITITFAETPKDTLHSSLRLEASGGVFFSTLPITSFSVAPVFTDGVVTDKIITQNQLYPTVEPFAAGNYRLTNDLHWTRWKSNMYWSGAVAINPNTLSADFATGPSISWRAIMVSTFCHFGHGVRLTQGLKTGQSLGASYSGSLPTETYWTTQFALGLSIRVPALTGR